MASVEHDVTFTSEQLAELRRRASRSLTKALKALLKVDPSLLALASQHSEEDLEEVLKNAFQAFLRPTVEVFVVSVDYKMTFWCMLRALNCDWVDHHIRAENFRQDLNLGKRDLTMELVHFNRVMTVGGYEPQGLVDIEFAKLGLRHATLTELLAFGAANPELQYKFPIVACGSSLRVYDQYQRYFIPYLTAIKKYQSYVEEIGLERQLTVGESYQRWGKQFRFLGVPKCWKSDKGIISASSY